MPNSDFQFGLAAGPDIYICSSDGAKKEKLDLDGAGVLGVGGALIAMTADLAAYAATADINTLAKLNAIVAGAPLIPTTDGRLSNARTPLAHTHPAGDLASGTVSIARGGTASGTASDARTALGLAIGTDVQAFHAALLSIAGLTTTADKLIYATGSNAYAVATLTSYMRTLLDDDDAAAARATLLLATMSQAEAEAGTATTTRAITAQRMKQAIVALGGGVVDLIQAQSTSGVSATDYTTGLTSAYNKLILDLDNWEPATDGAFPEILFSTDGGSTWAEAAGSYGWIVTGARIGNHEKQGSDSDTKIQLTPTGVSNVAGEGMSGTVVFHGAKSATSRCTMEWVLGYHDTGTRILSITGYAKRLADENIDAIRIQASDGNHSVVTALWGVKDA